jgi:hypothetical protein
VNVEDVVAIVRDEPFAPDRLSAGFDHLPRDIGLSHRNHFDG